MRSCSGSAALTVYLQSTYGALIRLLFRPLSSEVPAKQRKAASLGNRLPIARAVLPTSLDQLPSLQHRCVKGLPALCVQESVCVWVCVCKYTCVPQRRKIIALICTRCEAPHTSQMLPASGQGSQDACAQAKLQIPRPSRSAFPSMRHHESSCVTTNPHT